MKYYYLHLTKKQIVLAVVLVVVMELPLSLWERRIEFPSEQYVFITYAGLPFEAVRIRNTLDFKSSIRYDPDTVQRGEWYKNPYDAEQGFKGTFVYVRRTFECLWSGMTLNTMFFAVFSLGIVKLAVRIRDEIEYRRYCKLENSRAFSR